MSKIRERLIRKFRDPEYRHSYLESFLNSLIAMQIRALRERRDWTQERLALEVGTKQSVVSRIENSDYCGWSIETLRKLAKAFDMALSIKFVSHGDAIADIEKFGEDKLLRPDFEHDPVFATANSVIVAYPRLDREFVMLNEGKPEWMLMAATAHTSDPMNPAAWVAHG